MNWLDIVLGVILLGSMVSGLMRGLARTLVGMVTAVLAILLSIWFYGSAGAFVLDYVSHRSVANFVGFFLIFFSTLGLGALVGALLAKLFKWVGLGWLDRLLGMGFGLLRGLLISIGIVLLLCAFTQKPPPRAVVESRIAPYVTGSADALATLAPRELKDGFRHSYEMIQKVWQEMAKVARHST